MSNNNLDKRDQIEYMMKELEYIKEQLNVITELINKNIINHELLQGLVKRQELSSSLLTTIAQGVGTGLNGIVNDISNIEKETSKLISDETYIKKLESKLDNKHNPSSIINGSIMIKSNETGQSASEWFNELNTPNFEEYNPEKIKGKKEAVKLRYTYKCMSELRKKLVTDNTQLHELLYKSDTYRKKVVKFGGESNEDKKSDALALSYEIRTIINTCWDKTIPVEILTLMNELIEKYNKPKNNNNN